MTKAAKNDDLAILRNLTPNKFRCSFGGCPAVFETENGEIVIVGKKPSSTISEQLKNKVSQDELAIVIERELLANLVTK